VSDYVKRYQDALKSVPRWEETVIGARQRSVRAANHDDPDASELALEYARAEAHLAEARLELEGALAALRSAPEGTREVICEFKNSRRIVRIIGHPRLAEAIRSGDVFLPGYHARKVGRDDIFIESRPGGSVVLLSSFGGHMGYPHHVFRPDGSEVYESSTRWPGVEVVLVWFASKPNFLGVLNVAEGGAFGHAGYNRRDKRILQRSGDRLEPYIPPIPRED